MTSIYFSGNVLSRLYLLHLVLLRQIHYDVHPRLELPEARIHDAGKLQRRKDLHAPGAVRHCSTGGVKAWSENGQDPRFMVEAL